MAEPMATEGASPQKKRGPPEEENLSLEAIREVVRGEICGSNAALKAELSHRMDRVEHGVTNQLEKILEKLAAIAGQQQRVVETIQGEQYAMNTRLQMLEQKVQGLQSAGASSTGDTDHGGRKPALIMGGGGGRFPGRRDAKPGPPNGQGPPHRHRYSASLRTGGQKRICHHAAGAQRRGGPAANAGAPVSGPQTCAPSQHPNGGA